ncbi:hypothetical protein ACH5RR_006871 [Cinchona calisaya]|uniref:Leucine-rich repeat-containing N-terminal plant-type domain-containing protein n=1 Tax=Cinchona calisaya TaxID=153742 RepID=A0ABD3AQA4_9GENT
MQKTNCSFLFLVYVTLFLRSLGITHGQPRNIISPIDLYALQKIKNSLTDIPSSHTTPSTRFFSTWDFPSHDSCSTFDGITCSSPFLIPRRVTSLILVTDLSDSLGLAGSLSQSISELSELNQLVLNAAIVTGPIPFQLGNIRSLRVISLTNNLFTGLIPISIFTLPNLHTLDLSKTSSGD